MHTFRKMQTHTTFTISHLRLNGSVSPRVCDDIYGIYIHFRFAFAEFDNLTSGSRGPLCFDCYQQLTTDDCDKIRVCGREEVYNVVPFRIICVVF
jgi:hypothetical protein